MLFNSEAHYHLAELATRKGIESLEQGNPDLARFFSDLATKHLSLARSVQERNEKRRAGWCFNQ